MYCTACALIARLCNDDLSMHPVHACVLTHEDNQLALYSDEWFTHLRNLCLRHSRACSVIVVHHAIAESAATHNPVKCCCRCALLSNDRELLVVTASVSEAAEGKAL